MSGLLLSAEMKANALTENDQRSWIKYTNSTCLKAKKNCRGNSDLSNHILEKDETWRGVLTFFN